MRIALTLTLRKKVPSRDPGGGSATGSSLLVLVLGGRIPGAGASGTGSPPFGPPEARKIEYSGVPSG